VTSPQHPVAQHAAATRPPRHEVAHLGHVELLAPDWRTITWTEAERAKGQAWGLKTIESFHTHGTPPVG